MKIFCIGFHKTGTTSLSAALQLLGYRVTGPNGWSDPDIARKVHQMVDDLVPQFDAFQDNPWPILYRYLDEKYPGSKFILTLRDPEAWIRSQVNHFGDTTTPMRQWIYGDEHGAPKGSEAIYTGRFNQHYREVRDYFAERPEDLLEMDLARGDGWDSLCPFLGVNIPPQPFPHANKASTRAKQAGWVGSVKRALRDNLRKLSVQL